MLLRSRLDRAFARYARTGDALALGRVFDATAPDLYRLGFHLLGDRHAAEDLVQQTFVVAIEEAHTFAAGRAVVPWLSGILVHRALHARRQLRQRAGKAASIDVVVDPVAEAAARELSATVVAAVRALPEPYRQVLVLHIVHELTPKEVADALARSDATVRTQLARGLELLRKVLPAGVAAFARAGAAPPIGLGVVRAAVLAEAGRHGAAAAGVAITTFGGLLLMKKVLLGVAVLLLLLGAWSLWTSIEPPSRSDAMVGTGAAAAVATAGVPTIAAIAESPTVREAVPPPAGSELATLEVLVRWSDGTPAGDVTVRCLPVSSHAEYWYLSVGRDRELQLRAARTDRDGVARFGDLWPGKALATADRGGKVELELAANAPNRYTLDIPRGFDMHGRVIDPDDRPIAGAIVCLSVAPSSDESEPVAIAGIDGSFTIRSAGMRHLITAGAPGYGCACVDWVSEEKAREECILRLRRAPGVLVGTVLDPEDHPVANARVLVGVTMPDSVSGRSGSMAGCIHGQDLWPSRCLRTDATGVFRAEGLPPLPWPVWIGAPGFAPFHETVGVAADRETRVTLRLRQGGRIRGRVTDAAGAPIPKAEVIAWYEQLSPVHDLIGCGTRQHQPLWASLNVATDAQGVFLIDHVMPGKLGIHAYDLEGSSRVAQLEVAEAQDVEWNPTLVPPLLRLQGCVVDEGDQPMPGWIVRYEALATPTDSDTIGINAKGVFRSGNVQDAVYRLFVQPRDPIFGPSRPVGEFRPGPDLIRIVVPRDALPAGGLRGQLLGPNDRPCSGVSLDITNQIPGQSASASTDGEGRYQSPPLPKGRYRVSFQSEELGFYTIGDGDVPVDGTADLGVFRVPAPGRLVVTVVDSHGAVRPEVWLLPRDIEDLKTGGSLTQREGHAQGFLRPGRYLLSTWEQSPIAAMEIEVRSGVTTETRFVVPDSVPFRLRVPASAQQGLRQYWRNAENALLGTWRIDSDEPGKDLERSAPPGRYTLEVRDADGHSATTTFDLRATDPPMVVEMPLPIGK